MDPRVLKALEVLEAGMAKDLAIEDVAREVGLSLFHFHRLFLGAVGETPADYLRRIRLDAAALRLRWTQDSAGDVAASVGYASQAAFTRAFKQRFGMTPLHFRRDIERWPPLPIDGLLDHAASVVELESFRCIARRFFGPLQLVPQRWRSFLHDLPEAIERVRLGPCIGFVYDDPRFTPPEQVRYDCSVVISFAAVVEPRLLARRELRDLLTRPGRYVCQPHRGGYVHVGKSYSRLLDHWIAGSGYTITEDPGIEFYPVPQGRIDDDLLEISLLLPVR